MVKNERNSSIELVRIIAMVMIITSHYTVHSGFDIENMVASGATKQAFLLTLTPLGYVGIDLFMLIFGYFSFKMNLSIKKIWDIEYEVWIHSVVIFLGALLFGVCHISFDLAIKNVFPTITDQYGYPTLYMMILLFSPILNEGIRKINRSQFYICLLIFVLLWSVLPNVSILSFYNNTFTDYLLMYLLGVSINYIGELPYSKRVGLVIIFVSIFVYILIEIFLFNYALKDWQNYSYCKIPLKRNSILTILFCYGLILFSSKFIFNSKILNKIARLVFGVYLIHDNNNVRYFLWNKIVKASEVPYKYLPYHMLFSVFIIFAICATIEYIHQCMKKILYYRIGGYFREKH